MFLVGFTGKAGSGKDTAAQVLVDAGWKKVSFADPIKEMLITLDPFVSIGHGRLSEVLGSGYDLDQAKRDYPEVRRLLQVLGTECGRDIIGKHLPNPWLEIAKAKIYEHQDNGHNVVVTDVRFDDEAAMINGMDGSVIRINRHTDSQSSHKSESGVSDALMSITLDNTGSIDDLHWQVQMVASSGF